MVKSMTAYGRSLRQSSLGKWLIEVHSVNKKSIDFNILIPKDLFQFDLEIRKKIALLFKRGQITVKISLYPCESCCDLNQRIQTLCFLKKEMEKACKEVGCATEEISFPFLYEEMKAFSSSALLIETEQVKEELMSGLEEALEACVKMKKAEGLALSEACENHIFDLKKFLHSIKEKVQGLEERYRKKILDKLQDFKEITAEDKDRVLREVFFYIEKSDITEEITRMFSHIEQFVKILSSEEPSVGRTMDFLIQEMGREVNTIASKSDDLEISYAALKMKGEIEKIREQAQNIE
jgi:uncharacterized protein (TIGR00255 family)